MSSNVCAAYGWTMFHVMHDLAMAEVFALAACHAWGQGMEPAAETYEDREINRILGHP